MYKKLGKGVLIIRPLDSLLQPDGHSQKLGETVSPSFENQQDNEEVEEEKSKSDDEGDGDGELALNVELGGKTGQNSALLGIVWRFLSSLRHPADARVLPLLHITVGSFIVSVVRNVAANLGLAEVAGIVAVELQYLHF